MKQAGLFLLCSELESSVFRLDSTAGAALSEVVCAFSSGCSVGCGINVFNLL